MKYQVDSFKLVYEFSTCNIPKPAFELIVLDFQDYLPDRQVQNAGQRSQVRSQVTGHRSQVTGYRSQGTGHRSQVIGHRKRSKNS